MSTSKNILLELRDATFRAGACEVFEHTNWVLQRTERWAVVGPSGSGKSLFAAALCGRIPLIHGELQYRFRAPMGSSHERAIGHLSFEEQKAHGSDAFVQSRWNVLARDGALRVRELLSREQVEEINPFEIRDEEPGAIGAFLRRRRRAVRHLGIEPLLGRALMTLSNGEMRKVMLARVLCRRLRLLILDDPFAGLDAFSRRHFRGVVASLTRAGLPILLVTPRPEDMPSDFTHMLLIERCRVAAQGTAGRIRRLTGVRNLTQGAGVHQAPRRRIARVSAGLERKEGAAAVIALHNVTVRYGRAAILDRVSWIVDAGARWALLGPNGSGKSTLLSLIVGDNPQAYANDVRVFGKRRGDGASIWEIRKRIGFVAPELHWHLDDSATCAEVVLSGFAPADGNAHAPTGRQRRGVRRWLEVLGLGGVQGERMAALSAGQQRMTLIARALAPGPSLLILDEPCQGLDADQRGTVLRILDRVLRQSGASLIYVTHRLDEIPPAVTHILRLRKGRVVSRKRR